MNTNYRFTIAACRALARARSPDSLSGRSVVDKEGVSHASYGGFNMKHFVCFISSNWVVCFAKDLDANHDLPP